MATAAIRSSNWTRPPAAANWESRESIPTFAVHKEAHPGEPIRVRIGLDTGEVIKEGQDFFGKSVILAARIACQALGGEILVSPPLKALVESSGEFEFGDTQDVELKGLSGSHQVVDVKWDEKAVARTFAARRASIGLRKYFT